MGASRCKECGGSSFSEDLLSGAEVCEVCGSPRPMEKPDRNTAAASAMHRIPAPEKRPRKAGIQNHEGHTYGHEHPNYKAMRKAREFLGLARKARASVLEEDLCPPFHKSHSTSTWDMAPAISSAEEDDEYIRMGKERIQANDIDAIVARKFWSLFVLGFKTRPIRHSEEEGNWGAHEADWVIWELYVHLTVGNGQPWFISKWIGKHGLSDKFLRMGGPCSRECADFLRSQSPAAGGIEGMMRLLVDGGMDIPGDRGICATASQLYESSLPHIGQLGQPVLSLDGKELEFHVGSLVRIDGDGTQWWDEAEHSVYRMRHVPMAFAILQAMFDSRLHRTDAYASICAALRSEVTRYTSLEWDDSSEAWTSAMQSIDKVAWCQD